MNALKTPSHIVQGTGEAIRGNFNAAVDSATGDHEAAQRQQNIAARGVDEFEHGHYHGTGAGVTPKDTDRERVNRAVQGESATVGSTNYGPHGTNVGNKLDPRFDSDVDHRGTVSGSTNYGPHETNVGNKLDPRFDSDVDHRGTVGGSTNYGPHSTNVGNRVDPRVDDVYPIASDPRGSSFQPELLEQNFYERIKPGTSGFDAKAVSEARKSTESLASQKTLKKEDPKPALNAARRFSADINSSRADTFGALKRSGTESHIIINSLFGARRPSQDAKAGFLKLNDHEHDQNSNRSFDRDPESTKSESGSEKDEVKKGNEQETNKGVSRF
ncbi:hypothetical protein N0V90_000475 [Kalmusia sp. IMI 367209]|nr:hypothetical protein N0V90_000475 [Kalmusia sp. IMI 367209]